MIGAVIGVSRNVSVAVMLEPAFNAAVESVTKGLPRGGAFAVVPLAFISVAEALRLSSTSEIGPGSRFPLTFVTLTICVLVVGPVSLKE